MTKPVRPARAPSAPNAQKKAATKESVTKESDHEASPAPPETPVEPDEAAVPQRPVEDILLHKDFVAVRNRQIAGTLALYDLQRFPGGYAVDPWRVLLLGQIMGMVSIERDGPTTATPTELKQRMTTYGLYSPRQIDAYLSRLVQTGDLEVSVSSQDRRMRLLRPLPPLVDWYWSFLNLYHSSYRDLFPERSFNLIEHRDAGFLPFMARVGADKLSSTNSIALMTRDPAFTVFYARSSGSLIFHVALNLQIHHPGRAIREGDLLAHMARFGCSRSHLRNLIGLAIETGFFEENGSRRQDLRLTERLIATMNHYIADTIRASEWTYRRAERQYRKA